MKTCSVEGCKKKVYCKGLCNAHYIKQQRYGNPLGGSWSWNQYGKYCKVDGCNRLAQSRGYCTKHVQRLRKYGTTEPTEKMKIRKQTNKERILNRVKVNDKTGCWEWTEKRDKQGYGIFWYHGTPFRAHRAAYIELVGPIPEGLWVLHKCDNPCCVNPDHLFLGTCQDNVDDMVAKGRQCRGEKQGNAKLTEKNVIKIKKMFKTFVPNKSMSAQCNVIAEKFCVSGRLIRKIYQGHLWKHVKI